MLRSSLICDYEPLSSPRRQETSSQSYHSAVASRTNINQTRQLCGRVLDILDLEMSLLHTSIPAKSFHEVQKCVRTNRRRNHLETGDLTDLPRKLIISGYLPNILHIWVSYLINLEHFKSNASLGQDFTSDHAKIKLKG